MLLAPGAPVWEDGFLSLDEMMNAMEEALAAVPGLCSDERSHAMQHAKFQYEQERQAAMGDLHSKNQVVTNVKSALQGMNCSPDEVRRGIEAAELRFEQLLRDREVLPISALAHSTRIHSPA